MHGKDKFGGRNTYIPIEELGKQIFIWLGCLKQLETVGEKTFALNPLPNNIREFQLVNASWFIGESYSDN